MNLKAELIAMALIIIMAAFGTGYLLGYASAVRLEMRRDLASH